MSPFPAGPASKGDVCLSTGRALPSQCCKPAVSIAAVEHVRKMRGISQSQLMRCSDGKYYVVKFQNNPQGVRILANELFCARLATALGLPVAPFGIVNVREDLIRLSVEMRMERPRNGEPYQPGLSFGSKYPGPTVTVYDFLPREIVRSCENLQDFAGILVFDLWTSNCDQRQMVFHCEAENGPYRATMIDQGNCFRATGWDFRDLGHLALYTQKEVYFDVTSISSFQPWLRKLESKLDKKLLLEMASQIPSEWYESNLEALEKLVEELDSRRYRVRETLKKLHCAHPEAFPNWRHSGKYRSQPAKKYQRVGVEAKVGFP